MKKIVLIFVVVFTITLIAGCSSTGNSEDYIKNDLMANSDLIPFEPALGGRMGFYSKEDIQLLEDNKVLAYFEDGHIGGRMTLKYEINDGEIEWTVLEAKLD